MARSIGSCWPAISGRPSRLMMPAIPHMSDQFYFPAGGSAQRIIPGRLLRCRSANAEISGCSAELSSRPGRCRRPVPAKPATRAYRRALPAGGRRRRQPCIGATRRRLGVPAHLASVATVPVYRHPQRESDATAARTASRLRRSSRARRLRVLRSGRSNSDDSSRSPVRIHCCRRDIPAQETAGRFLPGRASS